MSQLTGRYIEEFLTEAREHVARMNAAVLTIEKRPSDVASLHEMLRAAHTLKGMAATMGYSQMAALCHELENVLAVIQQGAVTIDQCADILFQTLDALSASLMSILHESNENNMQDQIVRLSDLVEHPNPSLRQVPPAVAPEMGPIEPIHTIGVSIEKLDALLNLTEELLVARMRLAQIKDKQNIPELSATIESVGRLIGELQYNVMQARMVSIGFVFERFPRMMRDLAKSQNKEIEIIMQGAEIELDRAMIEEIGECLVHLLRNAVDHGIEQPDERVRKGKPRAGTIHLTATRSKQSATIVVQDDGAGVDLERVIEVGNKGGVLPTNATKQQILQSLFQGVSTTSHVTAVSGRGIGLNICKRKAEAVGGSICIESVAGKGTTFTIEIPLTMAVIKTLFVGVGERTYAIPVSTIERLVLAEDAEVKSALGREAIVLEEQEIPICRLRTLFNCPCLPPKRQPIVIVQKEQSRIGLVVDSLMFTEEVVVKPLTALLRENHLFTGSALIGSGEVVMVLEVGHLMNESRN